MREDLVPDVSLGTHFFSELVEANLLYVAIFPQHPQNYLNESFFVGATNRLTEIVPGATQWLETVRVIDAREVAGPHRTVLFTADVERQEARFFLSASPDQR